MCESFSLLIDQLVLNSKGSITICFNLSAHRLFPSAYSTSLRPQIALSAAPRHGECECEKRGR